MGSPAPPRRRTESGSGSGPVVDRHLTVGQLTLDFVSPADPSEVAGPGCDQRDWWRARHLVSRVSFPDDEAAALRPLLRKAMRAEWLAGRVADKLDYLLGMGYDAARYGAILYERIGNITVKVDGETIIKDYKIPEKLAALTPSNSFGAEVRGREKRQTYFDGWRRRAFAARVQAGLPVLPFVEEPPE